MSSITVFHHKILRGFLRLSQTSPIPSLYFLLGELPIENKIHLETLSLFYNIWANPSSKINQILQYILMMSDSTSTTWSNHIRILCQMYNLPDPLTLLKQSPWSKARWRELTLTNVTVHAEKKWRQLASTNSKMTYLNVQLLGLSGKPHPALSNINTTRDVTRLRLHLKFLTGDYLSFQLLANDQSNKDPHCRLCQASCEDIKHILTECRSTADVRERIFPDLLNVVAEVNPNSGILNLPSLTSNILTQFILDCGSSNLNNDFRLSYAHPGTPEVFRIARDWCFAINNARIRLLKKLKQTP